MQSLTAAPRDALADAAVRSLLTAASIQVSAGLELLDSSNRLVEDISDDLVGGEVARNNYAAIHGTCTLSLTRELAWGRDRVRPYMVLSDGITEARFNLGVFVLTTPDTRRGEELATYEAQGYDLLHLLQDGPGDTYVVTAGTTYLAAVQSVITASGIGATLRLDGSGQSTALLSDMVWCLTSSGTSWLRIINDLLAAIGYRGLWANQDGELRSEPYQAPAVRPVEWSFDTADAATNLVGEDRTLAMDVWGAPNWWKFVRNGMATKPVDGDGIYFPAANASDPASTTLGRLRRKVVFLDAANHASLVAQGDKIVAEDRQVARRFELSVDPLPIAGHFDVVQFVDAGSSDKCQVSSWSLPLDGSPGRWSLEAVNG